MSVPRYEFMTKSRNGVAEIVFAVEIAEHTVKYGLQQYVAAFLDHTVKVVAVDCVHKFVRFLDKVFPYAFVRLRSVPRTTFFGKQIVHYVKKVGYVVSFGVKIILGRDDESSCVRIFFFSVKVDKRYVCQFIRLFDRIYENGFFILTVNVDKFQF